MDRMPSDDQQLVWYWATHWTHHRAAWRATGKKLATSTWDEVQDFFEIKEKEDLENGKTTEAVWRAEDLRRKRQAKMGRIDSQRKQARDSSDYMERRIPRKKAQGYERRQRRDQRDPRDQKKQGYRESAKPSCPIHGEVGHSWMKCRRNPHKKPWPGLNAWIREEEAQKGRSDDRSKSVRFNQKKPEQAHLQDVDIDTYSSEEEDRESDDREDREEYDSHRESEAESEAEENFALDYEGETESRKRRSHAGHAHRRGAAKKSRRNGKKGKGSGPKKSRRKPAKYQASDDSSLDEYFTGHDE
jgi:hypothetical protein